MRCHVFILAMALGGQLLADDAYHVFCTNAIVAFATNVAASPTFTNDVSRFIAETNGFERESAQVVMAVAMYDYYGKSVDVAALDMCIDLCTNAIESVDSPCGSWQKSAASAVLATAFATKRQYGDSYSVCTNAIARYLSQPTSNDDVALWDAICNHHLLPGLSVRSSLDFYAALSLVFMANTSAISVYTNSLPSAAIQKILEAME